MICMKGNSIYAQDLNNHQWQNRIILILIDDEKNDTYKKQLIEFKKESTGLKERKLIVYHIKPNALKKGLNNNIWKKTKTKHKDYKKTNASFEILLIGLDGGIKLQQEDLLTCQALFSLIDVMPMRVNELKKPKAFCMSSSN